MPNNPKASFKFARHAAIAAGDTFPSLDIAVLEGAHAMAAAADAWMHLEKHGGAATPFQSHCVASACAAAHMQKEAVPRIVVVRRDGEPRIIIPTVVTQLFGFSVVRFLGDPLIQYADALACGDVMQDELTKALAVAADPEVACLALFLRVRSDAKIGTALANLAREIAVDESPLVDLRLPSVLTARAVREQRRQRLRLSERGELEVRVMVGAQARPWLAEALRLKREWIAAQGFTSLVVGSPDWELAIDDICSAQTSPLVAAVMMCGGNLAAVEIAFVNDTSWLGFIGAYAPEFAAYSPGQTLGVECMQWARDRGLTVYDQLPPSQSYKRRHATHSVSVRDYAMPLTPMAKLPLAMIKMIPSVKWMLAELPEDLRRAVLKLAG